MKFPSGSVMLVNSVMPDKENHCWWTKTVLHCQNLTDRCGCKIQYIKFGSVPILLILEKLVAKFAIII